MVTGSVSVHVEGWSPWTIDVQGGVTAGKAAVMAFSQNTKQGIGVGPANAFELLDGGDNTMKLRLKEGVATMAMKERQSLPPGLEQLGANVGIPKPEPVQVFDSPLQRRLRASEEDDSVPWWQRRSRLSI